MSFSSRLYSVRRLLLKVGHSEAISTPLITEFPEITRPALDPQVRNSHNANASLIKAKP